MTEQNKTAVGKCDEDKDKDEQEMKKIRHGIFECDQNNGQPRSGEEYLEDLEQEKEQVDHGADAVRALVSNGNGDAILDVINLAVSESLRFQRVGRVVDQRERMRAASDLAGHVIHLGH